MYCLAKVRSSEMSQARHLQPWPLHDREECERPVVSCNSTDRAHCLEGTWAQLEQDHVKAGKKWIELLAGTNNQRV